MKIFNDIKSINAFLEKSTGKKIGFVPTMGALHQGHLSLLREAKKHCDIVVASIFVNQKQFNNPTDYLKYPNTLEQDIKMLEGEGVDVLFNPDSKEIYGDNFQTSIIVSGLTNELCGKTRPGHFDGVALVVSKLFNIVKPHKAFFGEKDFQQLQLIKKLVKDLNIDVEIIACPTLRENDGLAMSSRNLRLSSKDREIAGQIYKILCLTKETIIANSNRNIDLILDQTAENLLEIGAEKIDYLQVCDEENLKPITVFDSKVKSRLFIAIFVGEVRLIDNVTLY